MHQLSIKSISSVLLLVLELASVEAGVIPETSRAADIVKLTERVPVCPPDKVKSPFFSTTSNFFKETYPRMLENAAFKLSVLPRDLSPADPSAPSVKSDFRCNPEPRDRENPELYPQPADSSSDCLRRDQDVRLIFFRDLIDFGSHIGTTAPYHLQKGLHSDCDKDTVTYEEFDSALENLAISYAVFLDEVDKQVCLAGLTDKTVAYRYLFEHREVDLKDGDDYNWQRYGVIHGFGTMIAAAKFRGEKFDDRGDELVKKTYDRFDQTMDLMKKRSTCTDFIRKTCEDLGIPLEEKFFSAGNSQGILAQSNIIDKCPAAMQ
ncbi:hypothetical protein ABW20_dc0100066 [Dactylellina cionopaga]|nr:hypothetical protein ABW20_dc0100066 [Dactylellina cionopaga]